MSNILLTGASGFIGSELVRELLAQQHKLTILSRNPATSTGLFGNKVSVVSWDFNSPLNLPACDHLIHLSGEPIFGHRWTSSFKAKLRSSRIIPTRELVQAIGRAQVKPQSFICASAVGFYGDRGDEWLEESSSGRSDFLAELCHDWEKAASPATSFGTRVAFLRIGIVLGRGGGALEKMLPPFKAGVGGRIGNGKQWMSWVHVKDMTAAIRHVMNTSSLSGPINVVSPQPVTNKDFSHTLGQTLHRPAFLPVPTLALRLAMGEVASVLTSSQRVKPRALLESGFQFQYEELHNALSQLV